MSNQICLKWNSFLNNIATSFESLWEEEGLVDVTLTSDGQCLTAHKVILSASSPFFKKVFQTNPCRHPVIILQDVRFRELEALLIFIYKGEVNIEQQNLPALLKAAETLKIRGLSGGDVFANQSYKRFVDLDVPELKDDALPKEETPKKKQKTSRKANNSILEKALTPQVSQLEITNDSVSIEATFDDVDPAPDPVLLRLEMKAEPLELSAEDFEKRSPSHKEPTERLDTGQSDPTQGSGNSPAEDISGLSGLSGLSGISGMSDEKPVLFAYQRLPYANLLPTPDIIGTWATSRPMDHLACDLMKILFTPEERILCNVNGKMGKQQFDGNKIHLIREVLLHFSGIVPDSPEWDEAWKNCVTKIDTSNRGSSKASLTVIPEARDVTMRDEPQSQSEAHGSKKSPEPGSTFSASPDDQVASPDINSPSEIVEPLTFPSDHNPNLSQPAFPSYTNSQDSTEESRGSNIIGGPTYPPFPCPFCDRAYTSWGFRRRHIKAVHTISPTLNCKWCLQVLPTHAAWRRHVVSAHNLSASDAHNGLLILEEAHMVLQIARPTRLDALVNIIKESSRQNTPHDSTSDKDKE